MPGSSANTDEKHLHLVGALDTDTGTLRIRMLGDFQISAGPRALEHREWKLRKSAKLVKLLALQPRYRMHRERVVDFLWPGLGPQNAANNLHRTLHEARRTLGLLLRNPGHLQLQDEHLILSPDVELRTDVDEFRAVADVARNTREPRAYRRAVETYGGELLPDDRYEEWTENHRRELQALYLDLHVELAAVYEERGEYRQAIETLRQIVTGNPAYEEAHASLMRLYALSGRRREALGQYERLAGILSVKIETEPAEEIKALYEQIRNLYENVKP